MKKPIITSQEQQALQAFITFLQQSISNKIVTVALFGSKARGDSQPDSDLDVLVILNQEDRELRRSILKQAARISLNYDVLLSPRIIGMERWKEMRGFSLYRNIIQDATGVDIVEGNLALKPVEIT
ncbi:MAG: nucleotidyltransferase domain-containing protein [Anaerolineales bacterium]|nr:nucleotidyltransferase domain-containing protein [Anaerolineales bacterium]